MCLGASNVSFGLPRRLALNAAFLPMAMAAGLTSAIMSTAEVCVDAVRAADLLLGHDEWGASWIAAHRARQATVAQAANRVVSSPSPQRRRLEYVASGRGRPRPRRRHRAGPAALHPRGRRGPRAERDARVRRGELERDRDRLDLRRPRDVQEVQGADRLRRRPGRPAGPAGVHDGRAPRGLAARVPRERPRRSGRRGAAAADPPEGGAGGRRAARDPAPGGPEAPPRARRADDGGSALRSTAGARRARRPRAACVDRGAAVARAGSCGPQASTSPRSCATRS